MGYMDLKMNRLRAYNKVNGWHERVKKLMAPAQQPQEPTSTTENVSNEASDRPSYMSWELKQVVAGGDVKCFITTLEKISAQLETIIQQRDYEGNTCLHVAAMYGRYELIGLLIDVYRSSDSQLLEQTNKEGDNALHTAVKAGHFAATELLLRWGTESWVSLSTQKNDMGNVPLDEALLHNHQHLVNLLVQWDGSSQFYVNNKGKSAVYLSVELGDVKTFNAMFKTIGFESTYTKGLLEENLMKGGSLLHAAISRKDKVMLEQILAKGMHMLLHVKDDNGYSPIEFASITGFHEGEYILHQELNKENIDTVDAWVNQQVLDHNPDSLCSSLVEDKDGEGVIQSSEWDRRHERMRKLLSNVMLPQQQPHGTCHHCMDLGLYEAAKKGNVDEFISVLEQFSEGKGLALPAIFGQLTPLKNTFLHVASTHGHKDLLLLIIQYFPSLLVRENSDCNTALHVAAETGKLYMVKIIATHGNIKRRKELAVNIDLDIDEATYLKKGLRVENNDGRTPLQVAYNHYKKEVVEFFIKEYVEEAYHVNKKGTSLLYSVILDGKIERLKTIFNTVSHYVDQNVLDDQLIKGRSLLLAAICSQKIDMLQELARQKPELIKVKDEHAQKLVHFAEYLGFHDGANYLRSEFKLEIVLDNIGATVIPQLPLQSYSLDTYSLSVIETVDPKIENIRQSMHLNMRHERMDKLLRNNALMPQEDQHEHSMDIKLYEAAKKGDIDSFIGALEEFSEANRSSLQTISKQRTHIRNTFLHVAATCGNEDLTGFIVHYFHNLLGLTNNRKNTANHEAARAGHLGVLDILVRFNNYQHQLTVSLKHDTSEAASRYKFGAGNMDGNTSLHEAFLNNQRPVIEYLIASSVEEAYEVNYKGKSGLYLAVEAGMVEVVKTMLSNMTPEVKFTYQLTSGMCIINAAIQRRSIVMLQEISRKIPEQIHAFDEDRQTPLLYAVSTGFLEGVKCLLDEFKMDASQMDSTGYYLVHVASKSGNVHILQKLMQNIPDVGWSRTRKGQNILHVAAMHGKENVVRFILQTSELKFLINEIDDDGNTPLHLATINCHPNIVSCLTWNHRVNLTLVNENGLTAVDAAEGYMEPMTSFHQRLTWSALISAGVPRAEKKYRRSSNKLSGKDERYNADYFKDRVNTLLLVATLVATVTFAAGFTMPGGYSNSEAKQGQATLLHNLLLQTFVICDTIALYSAIIVAVTLIWAQLGDPTLVLNALRFALPLLGLSLTTMSIAFMAGMSLVVGILTWLADFVLIFGIISLTSILALFIPLVFSYSSTSLVLRYITYYPFQLLVLVSGSSDDQHIKEDWCHR